MGILVRPSLPSGNILSWRLVMKHFVSGMVGTCFTCWFGRMKIVPVSYLVCPVLPFLSRWETPRRLDLDIKISLEARLD